MKFTVSTIHRGGRLATVDYFEEHIHTCGHADTNHQTVEADSADALVGWCKPLFPNHTFLIFSCAGGSYPCNFSREDKR